MLEIHMQMDMGFQIKAHPLFLTATTTEMALIKMPNTKINENPCSISHKLSYSRDIVIDGQQGCDI
jgi:hypothetical protein